jgi:hypothetical protein
LQAPLVPQVEAAAARQVPVGSGPAGRGAQVPSFPLTAQELQAPQAGDAQQTPSVQWSLMHSLPATQTAPFGLRLVHEPERQTVPDVQSPSEAQVVMQTPAPQT